MPSHNSKYYAKSLKTNPINSLKITTLSKRKSESDDEAGPSSKNSKSDMSLVVVLIAKHLNLSPYMIIQCCELLKLQLKV